MFNVKTYHKAQKINFLIYGKRNTKVQKTDCKHK
jgi:hypothetical protein